MRPRSTPRWRVLVCLVAVTVPAIARAERLPIKAYTTAEGLAHPVVNRIVRDSREFLWFCTREGLSRFDGHAFTTYGIEHGLPSAVINDLIETRDGRYFLATGAGLVRFDPLGSPGVTRIETGTTTRRMFTTYLPAEGDARARHVTSLLQDRTGVLWLGTQAGLYRVASSAEPSTPTFVDLGIPDHLEQRVISCLIEDRAGAIWAGSTSGIHRRWPDGRVEHLATGDGLPEERVRALLTDRDGRIWVGFSTGGISQLALDARSHRPNVVRTYTAVDGLPTGWIDQFVQKSDGGLWAATNAGLLQMIPNAKGTEVGFRTFGVAHGLADHEVRTLAEDREGNLWIGISSSGAARILRGGFTIFDGADGLAWAQGMVETRAGELVVFGGRGRREWCLNRFDGERFVCAWDGTATGTQTWGWGQTVVVDRAGDWWVATRKGVLRFQGVASAARLARAAPSHVYTRRHGLAADVVLRLFEDSRGDVWVGVVGEGLGSSGLSRWDRATETWQHYTERQGLPPLDRFYVASFAEDRGGGVWIGFSREGGLVRYARERFTRFTTEAGVPSGMIRNLLIDSQGRLWIASYRSGLGRLDLPAGPNPTFSRYTAAQGLSSNEVHVVTEDRWGRIYVGTPRGIDRLDPASGRIAPYSGGGGLPIGAMGSALRDRHGALWFTCLTGLVRLAGEADPPPRHWPTFITGIRIGGRPRPISALGETEVLAGSLPSDSNQLQIDFVAPHAGTVDTIRYQYMLEGADAGWSEPAEPRTVHYAGLAPGSYRFLVRAVSPRGDVPGRPARFAFTILRPVWMRGWFLALAATMLAASAYTFYRYRVARLVELANVRVRIATDLHDDIGANLTRISVLSEVARQRSATSDPSADGPLASIAALARESVAAMSDIVWAISPERDTVHDLVRKMRAHAEEVFAMGDVDLTFTAPVDAHHGTLGVDLRGDLLLIFKEAINNAARHGRCSRVEVDIRTNGADLRLTVHDNGIGFDATAESEGHGLVSMRRRAARLGTTLDIASRTGAGTTVRVAAPLGRRLRRPALPTSPGR